MRIVKFEKNGCMMCKRMDKILTDAEIHYETINLDEVENAQELIKKYEIKVAPTLVKVQTNGFQSLSGLHSAKDIKDFCEGTSGVDEHSFGEFHCENGVCKVQ